MWADGNQIVVPKREFEAIGKKLRVREETSDAGV
jgi:hypothetical protein